LSASPRSCALAAFAPTHAICYQILPPLSPLTPSPFSLSSGPHAALSLQIYKKALLKIHPDKFTQAGWREHTRQEERFKLINTAFEHEKKMASYRSSTSRFSFASSYDYAGWM
jgi:hypothetical protein